MTVLIIIEHKYIKIYKEKITIIDYITRTVHVQYIMPWKGLSVREKRMDVNILAISKFDKLWTVLGRFQIKNTEGEVMFGKTWSRELTDFSGFLASSHEDSSSVIESVRFL